MSLNIVNVDRLLAFMRALPPEHFTMAFCERPTCNTPGCIFGCIKVFTDSECVIVARNFMGTTTDVVSELFFPSNYNRANKTGDFPLARAIDVVQHLRDTGEVDWSRFPAERYRAAPAAPKPAWTPPVVIVVEPELPESLTSLLRRPVEA